MESSSYITYIQPKERFVLVSNSIVDKYESDVVGVYCKIVRLSAGKPLSLSFIAKRIKVTERKVRRIIVFLESEGYIVREPIRNERGHIKSWNYKLFPEAVPVSKRSHAGKRVDEDNSYLPKNQQVGIPTSRESNKLENGEVNILSNTKVLSNTDKNLDNNIKKKELSKDNPKKEEDIVFESYMKEHYPYLMKMDIPLTRQQAKQLKEKYGEDDILQLFDDMNNYKPLLKNCRDAYKTALNWCRRRGLQEINKNAED